MNDDTKNKEYDTMRRLAQSYFEGRLDDSGERHLLEYINSRSDGLQLLARWEDEWAGTLTASADTQTAWQQTAMRTRTATAKRGHTLRQRIVRWAAAAVVAGAVFAAGLAIGGLQPKEQYFCSSAPYGSTATTVLPDGSKVTLNAGSTIRYSSRFGDGNRRVELQGEAYFDVAHRGGARFTVATDGYDVEVRGTKFYVSAYKGDDFLTTTLVKGSVAVNYNDSTYMLRPGQRAMLCRSTGKLSTTSVAKMSNGWQIGHIDYDDITLGQLRPVIERRYDVSISIASHELAARHMYISLCNNETIDEVLAALKRTLGVNVARNGRNVSIRP